MKILVVDDSEEIASLFRTYFRDEIETNEMSFIFATDAMDAIHCLDELRPFDVFLVLSDMTMPGMSRAEIVEMIRGSWEQLDVILLGEHVSDNSFHTNAATHSMRCPIDFNTLRDRLHRHAPRALAATR